MWQPRGSHLAATALIALAAAISGLSLHPPAFAACPQARGSGVDWGAEREPGGTCCSSGGAQCWGGVQAHGAAVGGTVHRRGTVCMVQCVWGEHLCSVHLVAVFSLLGGILLALFVASML